MRVLTQRRVIDDVTESNTKRVALGLLLRATAAVLSVTLLLAGLFVFLERHMEQKLHGTHTEYCPPSHRTGQLRSCQVLDRSDGRVLIQHAELDGNRVYWEILTPPASQCFKLPPTSTQLAPQGCTAKLIAGKSDAVLLNGTETKLEPIAGPTF